MIREAVPKDVNSVYLLWRELMDWHQSHHPVFAYYPDRVAIIKTELLERLSEPTTKFFVFESAHELAGLLIATYRKTSEGMKLSRKGYIAETVIKEAFRNQGIGKALFEQARQWFIELGADHIELQVSLKNPSAMEFWQAQGFTPSTQHLVLKLNTEGEV